MKRTEKEIDEENEPSRREKERREEGKDGESRD
jgi:hypothetical protein